MTDAMVRQSFGRLSDDVSGALPEAGNALLVARDEIGKSIDPLLASIAQRLQMRGNSGDRDLAELIFAFLSA